MGVMEACNGGVAPAAGAEAAELQATIHSSWWYISSTFNLLIIITHIMHGMQGQNSRLPTPSFWYYLRHVYTVKSECKQCTERTGGEHLILDSRVL